MARRLPCPGSQCDYVTEEMDIQDAMAMLNMHKEIDHPARHSTDYLTQTREISEAKYHRGYYS